MGVSTGCVVATGVLMNEAYKEPRPLIMELRSPSAGSDDRNTKAPHYQRRGHDEIWRVHSIRWSDTRWCTQGGGSCHATAHITGTMMVHTLRDVVPNIDRLSAP